MFLIILKILAVWIVASFILAPFIGRFLKRRRMEQTNRDYPIPQGSILHKRSERVSQ